MMTTITNNKRDTHIVCLSFVVLAAQNDHHSPGGEAHAEDDPVAFDQVVDHRLVGRLPTAAHQQRKDIDEKEE